MLANKYCTDFYTTSVHSAQVLDASAVYEWNYQGAVITNDENTFANYCEYSFTTSWAMRYKKYFYPKYSVKHFGSSKGKNKT